MQTDTNIQHSTWIEINQNRLISNLEKIENHYGFDAKILAVVKANAYGHGLEGVSQALDGHVGYLGVSTVVEAMELKSFGLKTKIFLFGEFLKSELSVLIPEDFTLSVSSFEQAELIHEISKTLGKKTPIHVKIDTGMGRLGIAFRKAVQQIEKISELENVELEGIYTHFPTAEKNDGYTEKQLYDFNLLVSALDGKDIRFVFRHAANTAGLLKHRDSNMNLLRPGLSLYGLYPDISLNDLIEIEPVLTLKSNVMMVKRLVPGESVGYGREFVADKPTTIATIPIGYSHGYPFNTSGKGFVIIHNKRYPLAGRISMDYLCVNLGDDFAENGEEVILIGESENEKITATEIAKWANTIPYEILTGLSSRIPRIYI